MKELMKIIKGLCVSTAVLMSSSLFAQTENTNQTPPYGDNPNIFKVLADSQRRDILIMLRNERLNAGEIAEKLQITPAALSYHLKLLKNADLISEYKEKNFVYYEINTTVFDELIIWVNQFGGKKE